MGVWNVTHIIRDGETMTFEEYQGAGTATTFEMRADGSLVTRAYRNGTKINELTGTYESAGTALVMRFDSGRNLFMNYEFRDGVLRLTDNTGMVMILALEGRV